MISKLPEPDVKYGNTKDPDKRAAKLAEAKVDQVKKMALSPLYGRVCSVATMVDDVSSCVIDNVDSDEKERALLETVADKIFKSPLPICTWNGMNFDIPFFYKRALILGVKISVSLPYWMKRYTNIPHCDLMQVWCNWFGYEKLNNVASVLLNDVKIDFDVTTIKDLIKTPEGIKDVECYNIQDVILTNGILNKVNHILI